MKTLSTPRTVMLGAAAWLLLTGGARSAEPAREFLDALRNAGYHDTALDYLDHMASSPLAPEEFKQALLYERAVTLIGIARSQQDAAAREKWLDDAQVSLQRFLEERQSHPLAASAKSQLGDLLIARARLKIERSSTAAQPQLLAEAKGLYGQAYKLFFASQEELREQLTKMPVTIAPQETELLNRRDRLRDQYLQTQLLAAAVLEETAATEPQGSKDRSELLDRAATLYKDIYEKYYKLRPPGTTRRPEGLRARMYQGRAAQNDSKISQALVCYNDVLAEPSDQEDFRKLKTEALTLATKCWLDDSRPDYAEAVKRGAAWLEQVRPDEAQQPEWLELTLALAKAHKLLAEDIAKKAPKDKRVRSSQDEARELASLVAQHPGPCQQEALALLAALGGPAAEGAERPRPQTFAEAKKAGDDATEALRAADVVLQMASPRLEKETDAVVKQQLQRQVEDANKTAASSRTDAMGFYRVALSLADAATPIEQLNSVRHRTAALYYDQGDYYEAALLGEFVARRYPTASIAGRCARIALWAYHNLSVANKSGDRSFETVRLLDVADYVARQWPQEEVGKEAMEILIPLTIAAGKLDKAEEYLAKVPADSPQRGNAELQMGNSLWDAYIGGVKELRRWEADGPPAGADIAARKSSLEDTRRRAEQTLSGGIARMAKSGEISKEIAVAVLYLAEIYVDTGQAAKALELLEDDRIGVLKLVRQKHLATQQPGFAEETYKTALRASISSLPSAKDAEAAIAKAKEIMAVLKNEAAASAEGQQRLIATYYSLALDLKRQLELVQSNDAREALSKGFDTFLEQVGQGADELDVIYWVAEMFLGMGDQYPAVEGKLPAAAARYYAKAIATYQRILDKGKSTPGWLSADMSIRIRMRLAVANRHLGEFKKAVDGLEEVLLEKNLWLQGQLEAARTYQEWASRADPRYYKLAIRGGRLNKSTNRNTIWGWGETAQRAARDKQSRDAFFEARYNLALCRYQDSQRRGNESNQKDLLSAAKQDILTTALLYRDLGGEQWRPKYDVLLKAIQRKLGEKPVGLEVVKERAAGRKGPDIGGR